MTNCTCPTPTRDAGALNPRQPQMKAAPAASAERAAAQPKFTQAAAASPDPAGVVIHVNGKQIYNSAGRGPMPNAVSPKLRVGDPKSSETDLRLSRVEEAVAILATGEGDEPSGGSSHAHDHAMAPRRAPMFSRPEFEARCRVQAIASAREIRSLGDMMRQHYAETR
jgi:hypothetical protein